MWDDNNKNMPLQWNVVAPAVDEADFAARDFAALEAELSGDLATLAAQLGDDANRLAAKYPPGALTWVGSVFPTGGSQVISSDSETEPRPLRAATWVSVAAAIALATIIGSGAIIAWYIHSDAHVVVVEARREARPINDVALSPVARPAQSSAANSAAVPEEFSGFQELNGPEQEALLDLLEGRAVGQVSLSI